MVQQIVDPGSLRKLAGSKVSSEPTWFKQMCPASLNKLAGHKMFEPLVSNILVDDYDDYEHVTIIAIMLIRTMMMMTMTSMIIMLIMRQFIYMYIAYIYMCIYVWYMDFAYI